jgi:hypothetical protein
MKTIIKLLVAIVALTACFNAGRAALNNFQFEDAAQQKLLFDSRASDEEVVAIVMDLARQYALPIREENVTVQMIGQDRVVEMPYTINVVLVPGVYTHPWQFAPKASTRLLTGGGR